jgi:hypothetical protein
VTPLSNDFSELWDDDVPRNSALTGIRNGQPLGGNGRVTFVVTKRSEDWKIVHFHRSAMPS